MNITTHNPAFQPLTNKSTILQACVIRTNQELGSIALSIWPYKLQ